MKNLYLNSLTGDIDIKNFNLRFTESQTEWLSQKLKNKLKTFFGEWFVNQTLGIEYFQKILKKQVNLNQVGTILKKEIKNTNGVNKIINFKVDYDRNLRKFIVDFEILTIEQGENISVIGSVSI